MENQSENLQTLEDIIFQNRNKTYGAYVLRNDYRNVIKKALIIGISIFGLGIITPMLWGKVQLTNQQIVIADVMDVALPPENEKIEPIEPETPPPAKPEPQIKTIAYLEPKIVEDEKLTEPLPDQETLNDTDAQISDKTQDGEVMEIPVDDPDAHKSTQPEIPVVVETEEKDKIFVSVEQNPEFAGGQAALLRFLQKNLRYPNQAVNAGVMGKVFMQFVVGKDGAISNVDVLKGIGFGCDEEAQRVVKLMPRWSPGKQSGRAVAVKFTLPIMFQLSE
ncbi:MAG: TonB family protein [Arcicella sp.]|jgi:protein TonB|nr:TonB family protein [Arcicella sp.]